jgi:glycosyltransferase involved in cell wall biosynthesis
MVAMEGNPMTERPCISVVIPCYNAAPLIGETLESVFRQEGVTLEVIVVDDGSTDGSALLVERAFPAAIVVRQENAGVSAARNRGMALAKHPLLQFLDADDLLEPGKLAIQARALLDPSSDIAYGDWDRICRRGDTWQLMETISRRLTSGAEEVELFMSRFWAPPAVYLMKREIVFRVGAWSSTLPVIQDARYMLDCALHGGRFVYCPGKMARYRAEQPGSLSKRNRSAFLRDCLINAQEMEEWWRSRGLLDSVRKRAVLDVEATVAKNAFGLDRALADEAYRSVVALDPRYVPAEPPKMRWAAKLLGLRAALHLAHWYDRIWRPQPRSVGP